MGSVANGANHGTPVAYNLAFPIVNLRMATHLMPDDLDRRILAELERNARLSWRAVASRVGSTTPTVALRVRRMEEAGLIRGYRAVSPLLEAPHRPSAWACAFCRGPIRLPGRVRRVGDRYAAFCCLGCERSFVARLIRLSAGPTGRGARTVLARRRP